MFKVNEIYKGFLDLITSLEEKFPGGVCGAYVALNLESIEVSNVHKELLLVEPTTEITRKEFIKPACDRFNLLGSTQLAVADINDKAWIYTKDITPLMYVLYSRIRSSAHPSERMLVATGVRRLVLLLRQFSLDVYDLHNVHQMREHLVHYEQHHPKGSEEGEALWKVLHRHDQDIKTKELEALEHVEHP